MNSPFGNNPKTDFRPRPVSASDDATEQDKLRVTRPPQRDFRPKAVVIGPKGIAPTGAPTEDDKVSPAHPSVSPETSEKTGENTPPASQPLTPKSSSPKPPVIPSKPSDIA